MIAKSSFMEAFSYAAKLHQTKYGINLPKAIDTAREFLPDRRYKVFALAKKGNGHGDTGGLIECAGIKLWWDWTTDGRIVFEDYK